ncbi:NAD-dependent epimerase/dehydratase family protein [Arcticibacterium luteifluviistationis]|uniref:Epimerase n=1 Tax=Arcticibacterium luteifluviistationis TaxID=1784714 RepID=A0A2Z4GG57_9BACT|nr:NAD-dependent epimerase/dehydratase family protein [Arcticibacterium luteifluviistationis]AWV99974.1 epimerase [Arcticibacterium luteifluviistationis]
MRVLITGATGLLGGELCRQLSKNENYDIKCLVRKKSTTLSPSIEQIIGDILDVPSLNKALADVDFVIHAAAMVSFHKKDKEDLFLTNVQGTANLTNACDTHKIQKFIHVSSVAALGKPENLLNQEKETTITENNKWQDSPLNSSYAKSKYLAELEVWRAQAEGLNTAIVNPSVILGEGEWQKSSTQLFNYVNNGHKFYTNGSINYVDVQDVAHAIITLLENEITGERFILNAGKVSYKDFFNLIAKNFNKPAPSILLKDKLIAILWRAEAIRSFLTGAKPLITKETSNSAKNNFLFDNTKVKSQLNIKFQSIENSIQRVCKYLKEKDKKATPL